MQSWDSDGLWKKAKLFIDSASEHDHASPEFAFFAALSLECLGRSALTKIHRGAPNRSAYVMPCVASASRACSDLSQDSQALINSFR